MEPEVTHGRSLLIRIIDRFDAGGNLNSRGKGLQGSQRQQRHVWVEGGLFTQ